MRAPTAIVNGNEHRDIGDTAFGAALVNVGADAPDERFWLSFGDVMGLSGDYFRPGLGACSGDGARGVDDDVGAGTLFELARVPGAGGTRPTRAGLGAAAVICHVRWRVKPRRSTS